MQNISQLLFKKLKAAENKITTSHTLQRNFKLHSLPIYVPNKNNITTKLIAMGTIVQSVKNKKK